MFTTRETRSNQRGDNRAIATCTLAFARPIGAERVR
jgi:hypothetical protein